MAHYLTNDELKITVTDWKKTGVPSAELWLQMQRLADGLWTRYRYTQSKEDYVGECTIYLITQTLKYANPAKGNLFNFFTTCARRYGGKLRNKEIVQAQRNADILAEFIKRAETDRVELDREHDDEQPNYLRTDTETQEDSEPCLAL